MKLFIFSNTQLLFFIPGILAYSSLVYILFFNRDKTNFQIKIFPQVFLYLFSLVPLGLFIGIFIESRKKIVDGKKVYKFSYQSRENASIIIIISVVSIFLSIYNLTLK